MVPSSRWAQVKALFAAALDREPAARAAFLAAACPDDAMRQEVESLLVADAHAGSFIETPAAAVQMFAAPGRAPRGTSVPSLRAGDRLGPYDVVEFIGAGGMGEVYKARDARLGRDVALKVLVDAGADSHAALERFDREARSASALNHPNIVTIYDVGRASAGQEPLAYIAMELVEGSTLRSLLSSGAMPAQALLDIGVQIAEALAAAHTKGIVHRDLKPENIMIGREGRAKILDFGLASANVDIVYSLGELVGTAAYMSPQQASGHLVDFRSDQFAFGAILYEMATGHSPFQRDTVAETLAAIVEVDAKPLLQVTCGLPAPLDWIVTRCLAKRPEERYASTGALARELATVRLHLEHADVTADPRVRTHDLPAPRTRLIGRDGDVMSVRQRLLQADVRLLTVVGLGGCGKTRLAIEAAAGLVERFLGGVYFVGLASVTDPGMVASAVAQALEFPLNGGRPPTESRPMLLVLDNFEQVLSAAPLTTDLLDRWPALKILVTSRAALRVRGEHEFRVRALALPERAEGVSAKDLAEYPAVALFLERARAVRDEFASNEDDIRSVAEICARLDGLPLAIELAAARTKLFSPAAMVTRLNSRLELLARGPLDAPQRQRTLRHTMDWSHELLAPLEQKLFRRLSVFAGACTLEAAEAVCNVSGDLDRDVTDAIASLVDQSLIWRFDQSNGEVHVRMLETVREYASERLAESGEGATIRRAHAAYYLVLAEDAEIDLAAGRRCADWIDRLSIERDNIRAALDWLAATRNAEWGLRLSNALFLYWKSQAPAEGRDRLSQFAAMPEAARVPKLFARTLSTAGGLALDQADFTAARDLNEKALAVHARLENSGGMLVSLNNLAVLNREQGNYPAASALFLEIVRLLEKTGDRFSVAHAMSNLADAARAEGDFGRARSLHTECQSIFCELGDGAGMAWSLSHQADIAREQGDVAAARVLLEQAVRMFREQRNESAVARCLVDLGTVAREQNQSGESQSLYCEALSLFHAIGETVEVARVLEELVSCAVDQQSWDRALRLAAAASGLRDTLGSRFPPSKAAALERHLLIARNHMERSAAATAWMEGTKLSPEQLVVYLKSEA